MQEILKCLIATSTIWLSIIVLLVAYYLVYRWSKQAMRDIKKEHDVRIGNTSFIKWSADVEPDENSYS